MKKLIILTAVAVMASVSQAATFMWQLSTGESYAGMNVYAISGTTAASILSTFSSTDATAWTSAVEGFDFVTAGTGSRGSAKASIDGVNEGDSLVFAIVDGSIADGNKYYVTTDYTIPTGTTFTPPATGTAQRIAVSLAGSGTFSAAAVPEPTSGLLMLLGVAGLALRRRRA